MAFAFGLGACASPEEVHISVRPSEEFSLDQIFGKSGEAMGCRQMFDVYCHSLHSPKAQGNISVGKGAKASQVFQGRTKNDFSTAFFFYARAKLRARSRLPVDFRSALDAQDYFGKLARLLNRPPKAQMSLGARVEALRRSSQTEVIWNSAIRETVLRRMDAKYPGFHRLRENAIPLEEAVARRRIRKGLVSDIARTIWSRDPNWKAVASSFEILRRHFLLVISRLDIPEKVRTAWTERMTSVKLVIPGTLPGNAESGCSGTQSNAFYFTNLNLITVCAGDFNTEGILQTVAHELGHALDVDRALYLAERNSEVGRAIQSLRGRVCGRKAFSCEEWSGFKSAFESRLDRLGVFQPELPEFQRCLQKRPVLKTATDDDYQRIAETTIADQISDFASSGVFLRITKEKVPMVNGALAKNPNYMNPCEYNLWSQGEEDIDDEETELLFFTAEYRCSPAEPKDRLRLAIETSKQMATRLTKATLRMEGAFSSRESLASEGFASSPVERFADVLGSYTFASYLSEIRDNWLRRYLFLASSSWQCEQPSLDTLYPEESSEEQSFVFDSHAAAAQRKMESYSAPMRAALGCRLDFNASACELKFKSD
jgi:hypothetical protein